MCQFRCSPPAAERRTRLRPIPVYTGCYRPRPGGTGYAGGLAFFLPCPRPERTVACILKFTFCFSSSTNYRDSSARCAFKKAATEEDIISSTDGPSSLGNTKSWGGVRKNKSMVRTGARKTKAQSGVMRTNDGHGSSIGSGTRHPERRKSENNKSKARYVQGREKRNLKWRGGRAGGGVA